jgi:hypothetical protein
MLKNYTSCLGFVFMDAKGQNDLSLHELGTCTCGLPSCAICFLLRSPIIDNTHSILSIPATPDPWDGALFHTTESVESSIHDSPRRPVMISLEEATRDIGVREVCLVDALGLGTTSGIRSLPFPASLHHPRGTQGATRFKASEQQQRQGRQRTDTISTTSAKSNRTYQSTSRPFSDRLR